MRVRYLTIGIACLTYLGLGLVPSEVTAQRFRGSKFRRSSANRQSDGCPAQSAQMTTSSQWADGYNSSSDMTQSRNSDANQGQRQNWGQTEQARSGQKGPVVRGSQLIGLTIRGSDDQQLGVVKDFIVDSQGDCPTIYLAVEPDASMQVNQEYVLIPYSAMQYRSESQGGSNYFAMDVIGTGLRNAPRVGVNDWSSFNDRQVLGNVDQFYQQTQRSAARPIQGGSQQYNEQGTRPDFGTRPDGNTDRDITPRPDMGLPLDNETRDGTGTQSESPTNPDSATRNESGQAPNAGTLPDNKATEPVEQAVPRR